MKRKCFWPDEKVAFYERLGDRLRKQRMLLFRTQKEMAKRLDVSDAYVSQMEDGNRTLGAYELDRVYSVYYGNSLIDV
jgi:predicted transcriptional regulator